LLADFIAVLACNLEFYLRITQRIEAGHQKVRITVSKGGGTCKIKCDAQPKKDTSTAYQQTITGTWPRDFCVVIIFRAWRGLFDPGRV
jgi:hypothetical protein